MDKNYLSPQLRLVQGDCFTGAETDLQGNKLRDQSGKEITKWFIACAGRKGDPLVEAFKAKLEQFARFIAPQFFTGPGGACTHPKFSFKIVDGDGVDDNGKSNAGKPGFAGHWVFKFDSTFAPRCYQAGKYAPAEQLAMQAGVNPIPRGDYVRVAGSLDFNGQQQKPGIKTYFNMVEWCAQGERIISGPDAATVFGGGATPNAAPGYAPAPGQAPMYAGAVAGMPPPPPGIAAAAAVTYQAAPQYAAQGHTVDSLRASAPGVPDAQLVAQGWLVAVAAPAPAAPPAPPTPPAPPAPPQTPVQPHYAAMSPPLAPGGSAPPPPPAAPAAPANGAPGMRMVNPAWAYTDAIAAGWTDATLVQNGHMVPL